MVESLLNKGCDTYTLELRVAQFGFKRLVVESFLIERIRSNLFSMKDATLILWNQESSNLESKGR